MKTLFNKLILTGMASLIGFNSYSQTPSEKNSVVTNLINKLSTDSMLNKELKEFAIKNKEVYDDFRGFIKGRKKEGFAAHFKDSTYTCFFWDSLGQMNNYKFNGVGAKSVLLFHFAYISDPWESKVFVDFNLDGLNIEDGYKEDAEYFPFKIEVQNILTFPKENQFEIVKNYTNHLKQIMHHMKYKKY